MEMGGFADLPVIDCHVHFTPSPKRAADDLTRFGSFMTEVMERGRVSQVYLSGDWGGLLMKAQFAGRYYAGGKVPWCGQKAAAAAPPNWRAYLEGLMAAGFDGVGETGSKPAKREQFTPLAGSFYAGFWRYCESRRVPILCHVADPEEFWTPEIAPAWARSRGWVYGPEHPSKEELYADLETVLGRHPEMSLVLAHLNFFSADPDRAESFYRKYAHVAFDLTPGIEMFWNMTQARDRWRKFFMTHQDRLLFGTDIAPWQSVDQALARIWTVRTFLESDGEFVTPPEADELMTRYDQPFRGLGLPPEVLEKIYAGNFQRIFGKQARPTDLRLAANLAAEDGSEALAALLRGAV
jgi:predicted TIM-barrel fold metal-dependent hydrolase